MECPSCALEVDDARATECPFCGYEFPQHRRGLPTAAWVMAALLILPVLYLLYRLFG